MQAADRILKAIAISDIHLSHRAPLIRSVETDWYEVMERQLHELWQLADEHDVPILCAGDVFDKWNPPPQLINFAMKHLPTMYAVPGQHDLPYHNYEQMDRTAYGVLVESGRIIDICPEEPVSVNGMLIHGFPWSYDLRPIASGDSRLQIGLVHQYVWVRGAGYIGAPRESKLRCMRDVFEGFDGVVFGDNHTRFQESVKTSLGPTPVVNNGTFMRRKADEIKHVPTISMVYDVYGHVVFEPYELETPNDDQFLDIDEGIELVEKALDMTDFVHDLASMSAEAFDFVEALKRFCSKNQIDKLIRDKIMSVLDD